MKVEIEDWGWIESYCREACHNQDKEIALKVAELYLKMDQIENAEKIIEKVLKNNNYAPYTKLDRYQQKGLL